MASANKRILLPYQQRFVSDRSPLKVWVASRQIGKSFAISAEAVKEALTSPCENLILSRSERQSKSVIGKVKSHLRVLNVLVGDNVAEDKDLKSTEIALPNGSMIIGLPASPDTVRGFSGNIFLDEFAFHRDSSEIWKALYPTVTRGYKVRVTSTPNGLQNKFHSIWDDESNGFSRHITTIHDAIAEGLTLPGGAAIDVEALRRGLGDPEAWAQEYECRFIDEATAWLTYEMIAACEHREAALEPGGETGGEMYLGMDIGRKRDLSVLWLVERVGDVAWTRAVQVLERRPFAEQRGVLYRAMERHGVRRACIDSTGIGAQLAEEARERFGSRVEEVTFSGPVKEDLAITAKRAFEDRRVRVPRDEDVREDLHAVQRTVTRSGNVRLDAERSERGHADRFWALALALHAGSTPAAPVHYERVTPRRSFGTAPEDDEPRSSLRRPAVQGSGGRRAW